MAGAGEGDVEGAGGGRPDEARALLHCMREDIGGGCTPAQEQGLQSVALRDHGPHTSVGDLLAGGEVQVSKSVAQLASG